MTREDSSPAAKAKAKAMRAVNRGVAMARLSGLVMIVLGAIFALAGIRNPASPGFLISTAVFVNGIVEWRAATALRVLDEKAPGRLAINQAALGIEIAIYALWQGQVFNPEVIDGLLKSPIVAPVLDVYPPDFVIMIRERLPQFVRLFYYLVGAVAVLGCGGTALYYRSRLRNVVLAKAGTPPELPRN